MTLLTRRLIVAMSVGVAACAATLSAQQNW